MVNDTNMCVFTICISSYLEMSLFGRDFLFFFSFVCCLRGQKVLPEPGRQVSEGRGGASQAHKDEASSWPFGPLVLRSPLLVWPT